MDKQNDTILVITTTHLEQAPLSLTELCQLYTVHAEWIIKLVDEGILEPQGDRPGNWRFPADSCRRISIANRLQRDLRVNLPGAALAIELLDEIDRLQKRLSRFDRLL